MFVHVESIRLLRKIITSDDSPSLRIFIIFIPEEAVFMSVADPYQELSLSPRHRCSFLQHSSSCKQLSTFPGISFTQFRGVDALSRLSEFLKFYEVRQPNYG